MIEASDRSRRPLAFITTGSSATRWVLGTAIGAVAVIYGAMHWMVVDAGSDSLAGADKEWLLLAGVAAATIWVAGTISQIGSIPVRPPFGRLLAVQIAASFANLVLPAGSGGIGINIRFLRRHGLDSSSAVGSVGLNSLAGLVTHVLLLVGALVISPSVARSIHVPVAARSVLNIADGPAGWALVGVGAAILIALLLASSRSRWRKQAAERLKAASGRSIHELHRLWATARDPYRAAALWLGSLAAPLLHGLVLFAVLRSLGVAATVGTTIVVYLVVSSLAALVPSPGGIGALDITLLAGLAAMGVSPATALASVLGYRLITVWLPLLPGAFTLTILLRRRII